MKFKEYLVEMPTLSKYSRSSIKEKVPSYDTVMNSSPKEIGRYDNLKLMAYGKYHYALVDNEDHTVKFYSYITVRYTSLIKGGLPSQVMLWKDRDEISDTVYWNFLNKILPIHKIIASDDLQSVGGQLFWKEIVSRYATSSKHEVGYFDRFKNEFVPFTKNWKKEFDEQYEDKNFANVMYIKIK